MRALIATPAGALGLKGQLGAQLMETGVGTGHDSRARRRGQEGGQGRNGSARRRRVHSRRRVLLKHKHPVPVDWYPKGATPEGVTQMAGNSAEWCADYFDRASYSNAPPSGVAINPTGAKQALQPNTWYKFRVMFKGWCKANRAEYFTCTKRHSRPPLADASAGVSFRCVKDAPEQNSRGDAKPQKKNQ